MKQRIIVFAPHPDDETLGCGGTMAKRISEGYEVTVVVMTDGRHAFSKILGINSNPTPEELKNIRKEEVKRATKILGVPEKNLIFLEFEDGTLEVNAEKVEEKVIEILKKYLPTEAYFPYEKDYHPDHRAANKIVRNAIEKLELSVVKYQYSIVQSYGRIGPIIDGLLNLFKRNMIRIDTSEFVQLKKKALEEFKSETSLLSAKQKKPLVDNFNEHLKEVEIFFLHK